MLADEPQMVHRLMRCEQSADDALGHRQQGIFETRAGIARMKQQLRWSAIRLEQAVARDRIVAKEVAVEVRLHLVRKPARAIGLPARTAQHVGVAVELLEQKRDRPAAHHPVPQHGIDGLERIVPIALAKAKKMRTGDKARSYGRKQLFHMRS